LQANVSQDFGDLSVVASGEPIAAVSAPPQLEIILDASYSMNQTIGTRKKIDIAKESVTQIVKELPDDVTVGLRIYGHRIDTGKPGDCEDSELVVPFRKVDKNAIISKVKAVKALGNTPIAYSLSQLAADFRGAPGEKIVILATDGKEDCKGNPPSAVKELQEKGIKFRLEVIGLAFADRASKQQMEEIAHMTGGQFHEAKDAKTLVQAFQRTLAVPYDLVDSTGEKVTDGLTGQSQIKAPEGTFTVVIHGDKPIKIPNVRISRNRLTRVALKKEGQEIGVQVHGP
jgi:von Willebrand factor type A domain